MSRYRSDSDDFESFDDFDDFDDIGISVMEELDPEPQPKSGSFHAREFIVGIVLVLAVLAFAGWQWWQTDYRHSNYEFGEQAARRFDWDEARARFLEADGYRDAGKRAQAAADRIQERDQHYNLALEHFNSHRWAAALKELRAVKEVQPNYRDLASMEERAEGKVYNEALLGSIALRPSADPPGLYYRSESGWVWLEGSDQESTPWGQGTPDHILYDAPIEGRVPPSLPSRPANHSDLDEHRRELAGRKIMAATLDTGGGASGLSFRELPFSPSDFSWLEWNREGVWGIRVWDMEDSYAVPDPTPVRQKIQNIQQITYHAFGSRIMRSTNPTFYGMNVALIDYNRNGDGLLVANWTRHDNATFSVDLYLNSLSSGENKRLYSHNGGFVSARFSDDGRYVFLTTFKPVGSMLEDHALLMIDTAEYGPVRVLLEQKGVKAINGHVLDGQQFMNARLLQDGPYAGKVLLTQWISYTNHIRVVDPERRQVVLADVSITGNGLIGWNVVSTQGPDLVLWGIGSVNTFAPPVPARQTLVGVRISPGKPPVVARQSIERTSTVAGLRQRGSEFVYVIYRYNRQGRPMTVELYSVPLSDLERGRIPARSLHRYEYGGWDERQLPGSGFTFTFGSGMFAYLDQTTIRAVTYDGQVSLPLESDVAQLFNLELTGP